MPFTPITVEYSAEAHHTITLSASSALTLSLPTGASAIMVQALTQNVRYTLDNFTPTPSKGFQMKAGDPPKLIEITRGMVLKFIAETAGAVLEYEYGA